MIELKKQSYEKLIRQLIFLEESSNEIMEKLIREKLCPSREEFRQFIKVYTRKVESIFAHVKILDDPDDYRPAHQNAFPFIVIGCSFTLKDRDNRNIFCRLSPDIFESASGMIRSVYAFSESGLNLLLKEKDEECTVDLGGGFDDYVINSITFS